MSGQVTQVLAHLRRSGRAVQADVVDPQRLERGQRSADLGAEQHRPGRLDGHVDQQREVDIGRLHGPTGSDDRGFRLQKILRGLHQDRVDAAGDHPVDLRAVRVAQHVEPDVAERGQLRPRTDRAQYPPRAVRRGPSVGNLPGQPSAGFGQQTDPVGYAVLPRFAQLAPKVLVSTQSTPTAK